jgi:uncharacterized repeat protein (TIGR01451 family)
LVDSERFLFLFTMERGTMKYWIGLIIFFGIVWLSRGFTGAKALEQTPLPPVPNLTLTVSDAPDPVKLGQTLTYTITLTNDGTANATQTTATSHLDSHVTFVSASDGGSYDGGNLVTWNLDTIAPGETLNLLLTVTVTGSPDNGFLIANMVHVISGEGATDCDTVTTTVIAPKLEIVKTDDPDPVAVGGVLSYSIVISNVGYAEATGVVLTDTLDPQVTFSSANPAPDSHNGIVTWIIGTIAPWEVITHTLSVTVSPTATSPIENIACVDYVEDKEICDLERTDVLTPNLVIRKIAEPDPVGLGQPLTYTIEVENIGQANATNVVVSDDLDDAVTFVSASNGGQHDGQNPNGTVTWPPLPVLEPGEIEPFTVAVTVADNIQCGATFPNTAAVTSTEEANDTTTIETTVGGGVITVKACEDQNADGVCDSGGMLPPGILACLTDANGAPVGSCQAVTATFTVDAGVYTAKLAFTGESQGYYPTLASQQVEVSECGVAEITLPAVNPIHPKGVAVDQASGKAYVAFQGPKIGYEWPYPFVAVIDGESDAVLRTIPGGPDGIGRQPWGVAVSGDYAYVGSFGEGRISVIDIGTDTVIKNIQPNRADFQPTAPAVNPLNGRVHFPDYKGGRLVIIDGLDIITEPVIHVTPASWSPFEMIVVDDGQEGHNFVTMRDAIHPQKFKLASLNGLSGELNHPNINIGSGTGTPHAIGLWPHQDANEGRFFITFADDPRRPEVSFPNANKIALYTFPLSNPKDIIQRNVQLLPGGYAEAGLVYDDRTDLMLGTFAGFGYDSYKSDEKVCLGSPPGGTYTIDSEGNVGSGFTANTVVGIPALNGAQLDWQNPFEIAINVESGKVYVTDRCWSAISKKAGKGAVLIFNPSAIDEGQVQGTSSQAPASTADVNGDGRVDLQDITFIAARYGSSDLAADINRDGVVDIVDLSLVAAYFR